MPNTDTAPIEVGLFVTCLADLFRPEVAFATIKLLEQAGCQVEVPREQTCCGQPAFNSGDRHSSRAIARQTIAALEGYRYVVAPSGSCIGMLHSYPELFAADDPWRARAQALRARAFEISAFLVDRLQVRTSESGFKGRVTYHDACSGLRQLGIKQQPRQLLATIAGVELVEMAEAETCCGFGGTFCVKYPEISNRMVSDKIAAAVASGADTLVAGELGCLLNIAGKLKREGHALQVRHLVELLADLEATPAIGEADPHPLGQPL
jgi:L-lactate dehydrogenase complex protein LldE